MNKFSFLISSALLIATGSFAQAPAIQWQRCLLAFQGSQAYSIKQTPDSGYIVAGITNRDTLDLGAQNFGVSKLDKSGNIEWQKAYGGNNMDNAYSIALTTDGGYIVAGETFSTPLNPPFVSDITSFHGAKDGWIIKLSATGVKQWQRSYGGSGYEEFDDIVQTTDGGYIAIGYTTSHDGDVLNNINTNNSYWLVKINSVGAIEWQKAIGGRYGRSIRQTTDGGYIVTGSAAATDSSVSGNHGSFDYWVVKLTNTGSITWQQSLGGSYTDNGYDAKQTTDGGYVITGASTDRLGSYYMWTLRLDSAGMIQWQKTLSTGTGQGESIEQTADGGYIVAGKSSSDTGCHGGADFFVTKIDTAGNTEWKKCLGGSLNDFAHAVIPTYDGGYAVAGETISNNDGDVTGNDAGWNNMWVVKLGAGSALPLRLISFDVTYTRNVAYLTWQTAAEQAITGFAAERSADGIHFISIGNLPAKGENTGTVDYRFNDAAVLPGDNYYRIAITGKDGYIKYSSIKKIHVDKSVLISIKPNPIAGNSLVIDYSSSIASDAVLVINDVNGKQLLTKVLRVIKGSNIIKIDLNNYPAGNYYVAFKCNGEWQTIMFTKGN